MICVFNLYKIVKNIVDKLKNVHSVNHHLFLHLQDYVLN